MSRGSCFAGTAGRGQHRGKGPAPCRQPANSQNRGMGQESEVAGEHGLDCSIASTEAKHLMGHRERVLTLSICPSSGSPCGCWITPSEGLGSLWKHGVPLGWPKPSFPLGPPGLGAIRSGSEEELTDCSSLGHPWKKQKGSGTRLTSAFSLKNPMNSGVTLWEWDPTGAFINQAISRQLVVFFNLGLILSHQFKLKPPIG